jgi:hypothetical protein
MRVLIAVLMSLVAGCGEDPPYNFLECEGMMRRIENGAAPSNGYEDEVKRHCSHLVELVRKDVEK